MTDDFFTNYRFTVNKEFSERGLTNVVLDHKKKQITFCRSAFLDDLSWADKDLFDEAIIKPNSYINVKLYLCSKDFKKARQIRFHKMLPISYSPFSVLTAEGKSDHNVVETLTCQYRSLSVVDVHNDLDEAINFHAVEDLFV